MPDVDLTEMDLAVIECLHDRPDALPASLAPCLQAVFPENDEVEMREGESITRLRGRQLIGVDAGGRLFLTLLGRELAEGLKLEQQ